MKLSGLIKWEPTGYWMLQTASALAVCWCLFFAIFIDDGRVRIILDAALAGFNAAALFHNWLHRRRDHTSRRMFKVMEEQQELIRQIHATKAGDIAQEIADRLNDGLSIVGPDGPIPPSPTKH